MNPNFERDSLIAVLKSKRVWLVHLVANALLLVSFFYWLQIRDESGTWFAFTVVSGVLIVFFTLVLHGGTFEYFRAGTGSSFMGAMRRVLSRVPALLLWAAIFGLVLWLITGLWDYSAQAGGWTRHALPGVLRTSASPRSVISVASGFVWLLCLFVWPILFLPVGVAAAENGFRGLFERAAWRPFREVRFWIVYAVCFVVGAYVPYTLAYMIPKRPSPLSTQQWSMVLRLGIGYLLLITAWVALCAAMARAMSPPEVIAEKPSEPVPVA
jgi:hypothetical protein